MKVTAIYGTSHQGSTVLLARMLLHALPPDTQVQEFFLPRDFHHFCTGCNACFSAPEALCTQAAVELRPIVQAIDEADVLLFASPVYVYHVTGAMKSFLDHFGCRWIIHRPNPTMRQKTAVLLSTAAGGGLRTTLQDLQDSMNWWGVGRVLRYGTCVRALRCTDLSEPQKAKMAADMTRLARKLCRGFSAPSLGVRARYALSRRFGGGLTEADHIYWRDKGLLAAHSAKNTKHTAAK